MLAVLALAAQMPAALAAEAVSGPDQNLQVQNYSMTIGRDGVKRETTFTERVYRRNDQVWTERLIASESAGEDAHGGHSHPDAGSSPMWVRRQADGALDARLIERHQRRSIKVDSQYYGNIGFNGSWGSTFFLSDPQSLKNMRAIGAAKDGVQQYESKRGDLTVRVSWDVKGQYPRRVESLDAHGKARRETLVSVIEAPKVLPWNALAGYTEIDYSDLLD
ncbi:hypothetical protein BCF11_1498 [Collimonas sp. PA-H2]|uniref:hypothetical protein n=1 Tax=Collimonas sp. PA-H2 TaxID=1881062 RepID=UPI000BFA2A82|nr:hypothetical protein [Collimonas sp. PA-H2]PFH09111.1 hypothetical protein BCF11_1498 [Collimonas sp. PA-H2]